MVCVQSVQQMNICSTKFNSEQERIVTTVLAGEEFNLPTRYNPLKILGLGAFGVVCLAHDTVSNQKVAIKKIKHLFNTNDDTQTQLMQQIRALREIDIMKYCSHSNIIKLLDIILPQNDNFNDIYYVMEAMAGDLRFVINNRRRFIDDKHCCFFMYQILQGVNYLHSANILHRDLKPANILLDEKCNVKICDMGMAREMDEISSRLSTTYVQSRWYRAPELILNYSTITKASDMWAIGCIFAEMILRKPLLPGSSPIHQLELIVNLLGTPDECEIFGIPEGIDFITKVMSKTSGQKFSSLFPRANPLAIDLLSKLLQFNPEKRLTVEQALQHEYFKDLYNPSNIITASVPFRHQEKHLVNPYVAKNAILKSIKQYHYGDSFIEIETPSKRRHSISSIDTTEGTDFDLTGTMTRSHSKCKLCKELRPERSSSFEGLVLEVFEMD